jgi:hypothetical protein
MCTQLGVSRSGYYAWRGAGPCQRSKDDSALIAIMRKVYEEEARGNPGVRRMRAGLAALGHLVSQKRVHRLIQAAGLRGRHPRAWKRTTIGGDHPVAAPDLIGRDFTAEHPGTRWCGDVTYIKTWDGWAYLATVTAVGDPLSSLPVRESRQHDAPVRVRPGRIDRRAVQCDLMHNFRDQVDIRRGAGLAAAEPDHAGGTEHLGALGQIQPGLVGIHLQQPRTLAGLGTGDLRGHLIWAAVGSSVLADSVRQAGVDSPVSRLLRLSVMDQWIMVMERSGRVS